jgi:hypothetical protein
MRNTISKFNIKFEEHELFNKGLINDNEDLNKKIEE